MALSDLAVQTKLTHVSNIGRFATIRDDLKPGTHVISCELLEETADPGGGHDFRMISIMRWVAAPPPSLVPLLTRDYHAVYDPVRPPIVSLARVPRCERMYRPLHSPSASRMKPPPPAFRRFN